MTDKYKKIAERFKTDKKFALLFVLYLVAVVVTTFAFIYWEQQVSTITFVLFVIALIFLSAFTMLMAIVAIFRSLFVVAAGLSLILFIAQSYCGLAIEDQVSNDALKSLINMGLVFVGGLFILRLYRELFGDPEAKREFDKIGALQTFRDINKGKHSYLLLFLYASFMGLILGQLFQVLYPIFNNLCVY